MLSNSHRDQTDRPVSTSKHDAITVTATILAIKTLFKMTKRMEKKKWKKNEKNPFHPPTVEVDLIVHSKL